MTGRRLVMGLQFFPRGGSAQVTRYLLAALDGAGWDTTLVAGSLGRAGEETHAETFFAGLDARVVDYSPAVAIHQAGGDPFAAPIPMHASYEDRVDAPDAVLASVDPALTGRFVAVWDDAFRQAGIADAEVVHLHHLTPQLDAVTAQRPDVPLVVHLHGTDLKFLQAVQERMDVAEALGLTLETMPDHVDDGSTGSLDEHQHAVLAETRWSQWRHGAHWFTRLVIQARSADHLITVSEPDRETAIELFGVDDDRITALTNAVEIDRFHPEQLTVDDRRIRFRRWLVDDAQGWDASGQPGTVTYEEASLDRLLGSDGSQLVFIYVGRFTAAKRVPLLIRAFAAARSHTHRPISLVVWGGHPGEWEGEHPVEVAREVGDDGIFFTGWRGHGDLPAGLAASDLLVMPSVDDSFAQTALEAMAVGLPVLATESGGFPSMIDTGPTRPTGWLVPPDDLDALVDAFVALAADEGDLLARGANALAHARADLSWSGRVPAFEEVYEQAIAHRAARSR